MNIYLLISIIGFPGCLEGSQVDPTGRTPQPVTDIDPTPEDSAPQDTVTTGDTSTPGGPPASELSLAFNAIKTFHFSWTPSPGADTYTVYEVTDPGASAEEVGAFGAYDFSLDYEVPLFARLQARYWVESCNATGCTASPEIGIPPDWIDAIGYFKASNATLNDHLVGERFALSADGRTLAVGATGEDGGDTGTDGNPFNDGELNAGAVFVFTRDARGPGRRRPTSSPPTPIIAMSSVPRWPCPTTER